MRKVEYGMLAVKSALFGVATVDRVTPLHRPQHHPVNLDRQRDPIERSKVNENWVSKSGTWTTGFGQLHDIIPTAWSHMVYLSNY
jgi:hypothetical protein